MDSFDKNMNELLNTDNGGNVPQGFGWEENADAIYDKMEVQQKDERKPMLLWWLAGLVLVGAVAGVLWSQVLEQPVADVRQEVVPSSSPVPATAIVDVVTVDKSPSSANSKKAIDATETTRVEQKTQTVLPQRSLTTDTNSNISVGIERQPSQPTTAPAQNYTQVQRNTLNTSTIDNGIQLATVPAARESSPLAINKQTTPTAGDADPKERTSLYVESIAPTAIYGIAVADRLIDNAKQAKVLSEAVAVKQAFAHGLTLRGGSLLAMGSYGGAPQRNMYSSWLPGLHTGLEYTLTAESGWSYHVGYSYNMAVQLFDFRSEDVVLVQKDDVVTHIVTNALSGRTSEVRGDVSLPADRLRDYTTYNTYRSHAVSFLAAKTLLPTDSPWQLQAGLGVRYSLLRASSGYTLDAASEILDYTREQNIYSEQSLDVVAELSIARKLTQRLSLATYARANKAVSNWSTESMITYRPLLLEVGVGVTYTWAR